MPHIPRALVVEDDARMRRIVTKVLTGCGFMVRAAGDGVEALNAFRASREEPELICADIRMPNLDGREFARRLRADGVDVPIIFVSGTIQKAQEGYRDKSHIYLVSKPFSPVQLAEIIKEMMAKPRPAVGPRRAAEPVKTAAELPPAPEAPAPGYRPEDFPDRVKTKTQALTVPRAPDRPFGQPAAASAPPKAPPPARTPPASRAPAAPPPAPPAPPAAKPKPPAATAPPPPAAPQPAAAAPAAPPAAPATSEDGRVLVPGVPVPLIPPAPGVPGKRKKREHETTVIFLKPISAVEVPPAKPMPVRVPGALTPAEVAAGAPAPPGAAAPAGAAAPEQFVNVERRIRETAGSPGSKPGAWIPRLIIWPAAANAEATHAWTGAMAAALGAFAAAERLECYAFAAGAADTSGRRWRVRPGVRVDGALLEAVVDRRLQAWLLLAPGGLAAKDFDPHLTSKQLDRSNVLILGTVLADLNCASGAPLLELTFAREETTFLRTLHEECTRRGCSMRRDEWKPGSQSK